MKKWASENVFHSKAPVCTVTYCTMNCVVSKLILLMMAHNTKRPASCILALSPLLCCFYLGVWRRGLAVSVGRKGRVEGERDTRVEGHIEELKVCICCFFYLFFSCPLHGRDIKWTLLCHGAQALLNVAIHPFSLCTHTYVQFRSIFHLLREG